MNNRNMLMVYPEYKQTVSNVFQSKRSIDKIMWCKLPLKCSFINNVNIRIDISLCHWKFINSENLNCKITFSILVGWHLLMTILMHVDVERVLPVSIYIEICAWRLVYICKFLILRKVCNIRSLIKYCWWISSSSFI